MNEGINQSSNNQGGSRVAAKIFWDQFVYPKLYSAATRYGRNRKKIRVVGNLMLGILRAHYVITTMGDKHINPCNNTHLYTMSKKVFGR